jgi:hypothetical protein
MGLLNLKTSALVTGVEDDQDGGCRMYVGARSNGVYAIIEDEEAKEKLRREWGASLMGHLVVDLPPRDCLFTTGERP